MFGNKEVHEVDGREIKIVWKVKVDPAVIKEVTKVILTECSDDKATWKFPSLRFVIKRRGWGFLSRRKESIVEGITVGWVNTGDLIKGRRVININSHYLLPAMSGKSWQADLRSFIAHETTHLWQQTQAKIPSSWAKGFGKLWAKEFLFKGGKTSGVRALAFHFLGALLVEGVAKYCELNSIGKVNFHEFDFYDYQKSASFYIDQFNRDVGFLQLDENSTPSRKWFKSIKNALNHLFDGCYDIGMHMTYTILFMDRNITVAKLTEFTPHRFVRKYENCMILRKEKPVFSLTSGNGTLDYKELVHFLCKAATIK